MVSQNGEAAPSLPVPLFIGLCDCRMELQFYDVEIFFKSSLFPPVGYPYIPSFQAPELVVKFWSEPEVRGFLFCDPSEMLLLRKDLFFLF